MDYPNFHLEGIVVDKSELKDFDGPLSLILLLLQKNKIEIRDIKISEILDQYMEYLNEMQQLDLEIASEFIRMASYLLYIKTRTLLSSDEEVSELEILIESLEQLKAKDTLEQVEKIIPELSSAYKQGALYITKGQELLPDSNKAYRYSHSTADLLECLYGVLSISKEKVVDTETLKKAIPARVVYSVKDKSRHILNRLKLRNMTIGELYMECATKSEIVATFVSVLELCSMGNISISYSKDGKEYELSFTGGNMEEILDKIEEN